MATPGDDLINGTSGNDLLDGLGGNDTLYGLAGNDTLIGGIGTGRDYLDGGSGTDRMEGGDGDDTYVVDNTSDLVVELFNKGVDTILTSVTYTLSANVENGTVNGAQDVGIYGNDLNNVLTGGGGRNKLWAGAGNDTIYGDNGNDDLAGGLGDDYLSGGAASDALRPGLGHDTVDGTEADDRLHDTLYVEYASVTDAVTMLASAGTVRAGSANSIDFDDIEIFQVHSGRGDDRIETGAYNDTIDGGAGADTLAGGDGGDTYYLDSSGDRVIESASVLWNDVAYSSVSAVIPANIEVFYLTGTAVRAIGGSQDDYARGTEGDNILWGGGGDDTLVGDVGDDELSGGDGDDILIGDSPGGGSDTLTGGLGADQLTGGAGADVFRFRTSADCPVAYWTNLEQITDFSHDQGDLIDLSWIDANTGLAGNQAFVLIGHSSFHHLAGELRQQVDLYVDGSGDQYYLLSLEADTNGDGVADFQILFSYESMTDYDFAASDFIL